MYSAITDKWNKINIVSKGTNVLNVDLTEIGVTVDGEKCLINPDLVAISVSVHIYAQCTYIVFIYISPPSGTLLQSS